MVAGPGPHRGAHGRAGPRTQSGPAFGGTASPAITCGAGHGTATTDGQAVAAWSLVVSGGFGDAATVGASVAPLARRA